MIKVEFPTVEITYGRRADHTAVVAIDAIQYVELKEGELVIQACGGMMYCYGLQRDLKAAYTKLKWAMRTLHPAVVLTSAMGYRAENQYRLVCGNSVAYCGNHFFDLIHPEYNEGGQDG